MHGLIIRSIQCFLRDSHGPNVWSTVAAETPFSQAEIDVLRSYPDLDAERLISRAAQTVGQQVTDLLEDLGVYLASHPSSENLRRLLRFGGDTFTEFLFSLPEMPDRARFAVETLDLPRLELRQHFSGSFSLSVVEGLAGSGYVLAGILRAMADDYGSLVLLENVGRSGQAETISIQVLDLNFNHANTFNLLSTEVLQ